MRPELVKCFLQALLRESEALKLGWTEEMLQAYAGQGETATPRRERELAAGRAPLKLAYLGKARAQVAELLDGRTDPERRELAAAELLTAVFDVEAGTARGLAGVPPKKQLEMLERQGVVRPREAASKSGWERNDLCPDAAAQAPDFRSGGVVRVCRGDAGPGAGDVAVFPRVAGE